MGFGWKTLWRSINSLEKKQIKIVNLINLLTGSKISTDIYEKLEKEGEGDDLDARTNNPYINIDAKTEKTHKNDDKVPVSINQNRSFLPMRPKLLSKTGSYKKMNIEEDEDYEDDTPIEKGSFEKSHTHV